MLEVLAQSNFEMEVHSFFIMRSAFGTAHLCVEEDDEDIIYCKSEDIGTYVAAENEKGMVDKIMILKKYTPRQLINLYGEKGVRGNLGVDPDIEERAKTKARDKKDDKIEVVVVIEPRPNSERDPNALEQPLNFPIRTCMATAPQLKYYRPSDRQTSLKKTKTYWPKSWSTHASCIRAISKETLISEQAV
jgi:hypothetical protein